MPVPSQTNYQQHGSRYQAPALRQQPQQLLPPQQNSSLIEDLVKQMSKCGTTSQHGELNAVDQFQNDPLPNDSESERRRSRHGATMKRSSTDPLYGFDPKIEKTLRRLRKARNLVVNNSGSFDSIINSNRFCADNSIASSNIFVEPGQMENNDRTLKELATLDVRGPPQALKGIPCGLLHNKAARDIRGLHQNEGVSILPGWSSERLVVSSASAFQHLGDMKRTFLEKFFPASRTASIRKEICGIRQHTGETLHEYWERFNKLCATCPHHQISE
ncbi:hypothetical protein CR513_60278, partial [Mucuna pruriens]